MANVAVVFAGGTGKRMNTRSRPKQFLELHGRPILSYTLEAFNAHPEIDGIVLAVLEPWIGYCGELIARSGFHKVSAVVAGGDTAMASQYNGLQKAAELFPPDSVVLIHDGVRPLIDEETIRRNIASVRECGTAITVAAAVETVAIKDDDGKIGRIIERSRVEMARAPQSFYLRDILRAHGQAERDGLQFIDSASMMQHYGYVLNPVEGPPENIKITTPNDFYTFRALVDARESSQIFGI